jgi:CheY-like chemotaxis protein
VDLSQDSAPVILVVDDDPAVIYAARALLGRRGCWVESALRGLDAVARLRAGGVDAVILDLEMPEIDGLSVLSELVSRPPSPPVVLMAQRPTAAAREAVERGDAIALLQKPIDFAYAHTLLTGEVPETPLGVHPDPNKSLARLLKDALDQRPLTLSNEAPLPEGTPVLLSLPLGPARTVQLTGTAEAPRKGRRGLVLKLLPLSAAVRAELTEALAGRAGSARPPSRPSRPVEPEPEVVPKLKAADRASEKYHRGLRRLDQGHLPQAMQDLTHAQTLQPANLEYQAALKRAQQLTAQQRAQQLAAEARKRALREPREALAMLEEAIRLEPTRASLHLEAAELYLQLGEELNLAEDRLGAAIHLAPSDPVPRQHLTTLLERAGRPLEALWSCDVALALFPGDKVMLKAQERLQKRLATLPAAEKVGQPRSRRPR